MGSLHMTIQTAVLIETLADLGADVRWVSCNIFSTQDHAAAAVVVGRPENGRYGRGAARHSRIRLEGRDARGVLVVHERGARSGPMAAVPTLIVDDGGDATLVIHKGVRVRKGRARCRRSTRTTSRRSGASFSTARARSCQGPPSAVEQGGRRHPGVSEETTTGVHRLVRDGEGRRRCCFRPSTSTTRSPSPSSTTSTAAVTRCPTVSTARTDVMIGGKMAVVFGFGEVGKGCAQALRGQGCRVVVTEIDPICALQAAMEGYEVVAPRDVIDRGRHLHHRHRQLQHHHRRAHGAA